MNKKLVYICSPCRGEYESNIENAEMYSRMALLKGYIPITPHLYFTRFMDDTNREERSMAMDAGFQRLLMCSEVWVFGLDRPSAGMQAEIVIASRHGIPIKDGPEMLGIEAAQTAAKPFTPLHEIAERITTTKEGIACQNIETSKATRILPHTKH